MVIRYLKLFIVASVIINLLLIFLLCNNDEQKNKLDISKSTDFRTYVFEHDDTFRFVASIEADKAWLFLPQKTVSLIEVVVDSGKKFINDDITLWIKGQKADLVTGGKTYNDCKNNVYQAVWEHAKLNGVDFRAVGNEPGWYLEIIRDKNIIFVTNYGRDKYEFVSPSMTVDSELSITTYTINNDDHLGGVIIKAKPCQDTMTDREYESSVTVVLDGKTYKGCGKALH